MITDEQIDALTRQQWGEQHGVMLQAYRTYARAILALAAQAAEITDEQLDAMVREWFANEYEPFRERMRSAVLALTSPAAIGKEVK